MLTRRAALATAAATLSLPARAFPDRPVRLVVPWPAGGVADALSRAIAPPMQQALGQPVVIENRPGAVGAIAAELVARSPADGHTLFVSNSDTHAINPFVFRRLPYDPVADFAPVSLFAILPFVVLVGPSQPGVRSLPELLAAARAAPGKLTFGSWGVASGGRLGMEILLKAGGDLSMLHVPFQGSAPILQAVAAGQVDCAMLPPGGAMPLLQDGRLRALAVTSFTRLAVLPDVATLREGGLDLTPVSWLALHAPARTPVPVIDRLARVLDDVLQLPPIIAFFRAQAADAEATTPEGLAAFQREEVARWGAAVRLANLQPE
jgi:tripartite-type tricarboxylate transporter receptor subunit TctC